MENETILSKQLVEISKKLKKKYPHWLTMVGEGISKEKEWKNYSNVPCSYENARHISTGTIKSQFHRRLFMKVAAKLLLSATAESEEVSDLLKQVI